MANPFLAVKRRKLAEKAKAAANAQQTAKAKKLQADLPEAQKEFELLLNAVRRDSERISKLPRGRERVELKKELLVEYLPAIEKYIDGEAFRNEVFAWVIIWLWDTEDINQAMEYTRIAIEQGQIMPGRFKSTVAEFAARKMRDFAEQEKFSTDEEIALYAAFIEEVAAWNIPEQIIAELCAELGKIYFAKEDFKNADAALDKSYKLGGKVKTIREKCKKKLEPEPAKPAAKKPAAKKPAAKKKAAKKPAAKKPAAKKKAAKK
jgi:terminase small subunit